MQAVGSLLHHLLLIVLYFGAATVVASVDGNGPEVFNGTTATKLTLPPQFTSDYTHHDRLRFSKDPDSSPPFVLLVAENRSDTEGVYSWQGRNQGLFALNSTGATFLGEAPDAKGLYQFTSTPWHDVAYLGGKAYFDVGTGNLWTSDGTRAYIVEYIQDGDYLTHFVTFRGLVYFLAHIEKFEYHGVGSEKNKFVRSWQLWRSDGTPVGTFAMEEFTEEVEAMALTAAGDKFLLLTTRDVNGTTALRVSDGIISTEGSRILDVDAPNPKLRPGNTLWLDGRALFQADNGLWATDGNATTSYNLFDGQWHDLFLGQFSVSSNVCQYNCVEDNNKLFIIAQNGINGFVFSTYGIQDGVTPLNITTNNNLIGGMTYYEADGYNTTLSGFEGRMVFFPTFSDQQMVAVINEASVATSLYITDGTSYGTSVVKRIEDFMPIRGQILEDGRFVFRGLTDVWITDGTTRGTHVVAQFDEEVWGGERFIAQLQDGSVILSTYSLTSSTNDSDNEKISFWDLKVADISGEEEEEVVGSLIMDDPSTTVDDNKQDVQANQCMGTADWFGTKGSSGINLFKTYFDCDCEGDLSTYYTFHCRLGNYCFMDLANTTMELCINRNITFDFSVKEDGLKIEKGYHCIDYLKGGPSGRMCWVDNNVCALMVKEDHFYTTEYSANICRNQTLCPEFLVSELNYTAARAAELCPNITLGGQDCVEFRGDECAPYQRDGNIREDWRFFASTHDCSNVDPCAKSSCQEFRYSYPKPGRSVHVYPECDAALEGVVGDSDINGEDEIGGKLPSDSDSGVGAAEDGDTISKGGNTTNIEDVEIPPVNATEKGNATELEQSEQLDPKDATEPVGTSDPAPTVEDITDQDGVNNAATEHSSMIGTLFALVMIGVHY